eukprot:6204643-Pleurochrysis_carterae.AAC.1
MGFDPGSFTYRGLTQGLPVNYGRWIFSQLEAMSLRANYGLPSISRRDAMHNALLNERLWHWETGEFATPMDSLWHKFGMKQVLGNVLEETRADNEEVAEAMESSLPESEGYRAKVSPLEPPTPEE